MHTVVVAHRRALVAEGLHGALAGFPGIAALGAATSAPAAETLAARADAVAIDERLPGAEAAATRLRRRGVRLVWIGTSAGEDDEVRVSPDSSLSALAAALVPGMASPVRMSLSQQQRRVLALIAQGLTAKQVARSLAISPKTVEQHKTRIFEKLGVPNQAAAVRAAFVSSSRGAGL